MAGRCGSWAAATEDRWPSNGATMAGSSQTPASEPDFLLVNDGCGRSFSSVRIPQAQDGSGPAVMALDYDHKGLTDFVVLNGQGEIQGDHVAAALVPDIGQLGQADSKPANRWQQSALANRLAGDAEAQRAIVRALPGSIDIDPPEVN